MAHNAPGDASLVDGADGGIRATVKDYANSKPLAVVTVDTNGDPVASGGGGGGACTIANGADVVEGTLADAAVITDANGTVSGKLRGLVKWAFERMPAALGQALMAASLPVVIASNQSAVAMSAAALPLPAGAATDGNQTTEIARLTSVLAVLTAQLDVVLSTRLAEATFTSTLPTAAADGDAIANPTASKIYVFPRLRNNLGTWDKHRSVDALGDGTSGTGIGAGGLWGFNGTTFDRIRALANATNLSVGTLAAGLTGQFDDASPAAGVENSWSALRISQNRNLYVTIRDSAGNERGLKIDASGAIATTSAFPATSSMSIVADNAANVTLLASNTARLGATIANDSSAPLYVCLQATASLTKYTVRIPQYGYYEVPFGYTGIIDGIWETDPGDGAARVTELTA